MVAHKAAVQLGAKDMELRAKDMELRAKDVELHAKDVELGAKDSDFQLAKKVAEDVNGRLLRYHGLFSARGLLGKGTG